MPKKAKSGNSCCPVIRVKCDRPSKAQAKKLPTASGWKSWKPGKLGNVPAFLRSAEQVLSDKRVAQAAARVKSHKLMCTVKVGKASRRINVSKLKSVLSKVTAAQRKKRCIPSINGKLQKD